MTHTRKDKSHANFYFEIHGYFSREGQFFATITSLFSHFSPAFPKTLSDQNPTPTNLHNYPFSIYFWKTASKQGYTTYTQT